MTSEGAAGRTEAAWGAHLPELLEAAVEDVWCALEREVEHFILRNYARLGHVVVVHRRLRWRLQNLF